MKIKPEKFNPKVLFHCKSAATQDVSDHSHGFCMIYYVLSGQTTAFVDQKPYEIKKGDIVVMNKGQMHSHKQSDCVLFYFGIDDFQLEGADEGVVPVSSPVITPTKYADEIYECCRQIAQSI